jgi:hypothetical protein
MGYNTTHTTPGVFHVTFVSWNHMDMQMRDRLARRLADIDTDIVTIRFVFLVNDDFHFIDQHPDCRFFFCRCLEVLIDNPARKNQAKTGVYRVGIVMSKRQLIFDHKFRIATKDTVFIFGHVRAC